MSNSHDEDAHSRGVTSTDNLILNIHNLTPNIHNFTLNIPPGKSSAQDDQLTTLPSRN